MVACNTCTCQEDGSTSCTELSCEVTCEVDGSIYAVDEWWVSGECNTCTCQDDGEISCSDVTCGAEACTLQTPCTDGLASCFAPGQSIGCGMCMEPGTRVGVLKDDASCGEDQICEPAPGVGAHQHSVPSGLHRCL